MGWVYYHPPPSANTVSSRILSLYKGTMKTWWNLFFFLKSFQMEKFEIGGQHFPTLFFIWWALRSITAPLTVTSRKWFIRRRRRRRTSVKRLAPFLPSCCTQWIISFKSRTYDLGNPIIWQRCFEVSAISLFRGLYTAQCFRSVFFSLLI